MIPSRGAAVPQLVERGRSTLVRPGRRPHRVLLPAVPVLDPARYGQVPYRIHLGSHGSTWVSALRQQSVMVVGQAGTMKTRGVIAPNVLGWPGPVVAATTKPDLLRWCGGARTHLGDVWVFDPGEQLGALPDGLRRLGWSHLRGCASQDVAILRAEQLGAGHTGAGVENGSFWAGAGRQLLSRLLHAAALGQRPMSAVHRWVAKGDVGPAIELLAAAGEVDASRALQHLQAGQENGQNHLDNVLNQVQHMLAPYDSAVVRRHADEAVACGFDPVEFLERPSTVFVIAAADSSPDVSPLVVGLVEEIRAAANLLAGRSPAMTVPLPLLLALDETANICPLPSLDRIIFESRSKDIHVITVFQTYGQVTALFGELADGMLFQGGCSLFVGPQLDEHVVERLSALGGEETLRQSTVSHSRSTEGMTGGVRPWDAKHTTTTQHGWQQVPRFTQERVRSLPGTRAFALIRGHLGVIDVPPYDEIEPYASWARMGVVRDVVPGHAQSPP